MEGRVVEAGAVVGLGSFGVVPLAGEGKGVGESFGGFGETVAEGSVGVSVFHSTICGDYHTG